MTWREQLSKVTHPDGRKLVGASFRGVAFYVDSNSLDAGRRTATHEFLDSNDAATDDLGGAARVFRVEGYVLGDEYMSARDLLIDATSNVAGPGELVHPYYGRKRVQCGRVNIRESKSSGGIATFSLEFTLAQVATGPRTITDPKAEVRDASSKAFSANGDDLAAGFDVSGRPSFSLESLSADFASLVVSIESAVSPIVGFTQELARLSVDLDIMVLQASALVRTPAELIDGLKFAIQRLAKSIAAAPLDFAKALIESYGTPTQLPAIGDTSARVQERINQAALAGAMRTVLVTQAARILPDVAFASIEEAREMRGIVVAAIDVLAGTAGDALYPALLNLRSALIRAVPGDAELASLQTVTRKTTIPSLLLSYQLYGSVEKEADIIARNKIRNPGFIAGELQVLSDV